MEKLLNEMQVKINQLTTEGCHGCQIDHPSQRRHACCMLDLDERVLMYFDEAFSFIDSEFILPALKEVLYEKLLIQAVGPQTVPAGSPSRGGDVKVCVFDINQPSLPTPFTLFLCLFLSCGLFTCISVHKFSQYFPVLAVANNGSCVGQQNKIGHPVGCRFPC